MANPANPFVYRLPEEILLNTAEFLHDSRPALRNLCLVSSKLRPAAQQVLHSNAILQVSCGRHPNVNDAIRLLRTLLDRPDLAPKVKALRFSTVREDVDQLYAEKGFDLSGVREAALAKLTELGYGKPHPWWASVRNSIESAYCGLLFLLTPRLEDLWFTVKDHHRLPYTPDPISAFFGTSCPPNGPALAVESIKRLTTADLSLFRFGMDFANLTSLHVKDFHIESVLRLNGPNSIIGVPKLKNISVDTSIQFLDKERMINMRSDFGNIFAAFGCTDLDSLKIMLCFDAQHHDTKFDVAYFMSQLHSVSSTLVSLDIDLDFVHEDVHVWDWFLRNCENPITSFAQFPELRTLKLPQDFLFRRHLGGTGITPEELPPKLGTLRITAPTSDVEEWGRNFLNREFLEAPPLSLTLRCKDGLNRPAQYFLEDPAEVWSRLFYERDIYMAVLDLDNGVTGRLTQAYAAYATRTDVGEEEDEISSDED
ncbi:hypothetical protein BU26DRAFT_548127 [Trematosphaeria pertusa]|uniref:F-box domain-containing protein n=1 Tax=Trematosphaeria pertusa TaxID=390896 RepID=A0A6A6IT63_9PLEO|nr:uncharacterized protein BU26DRAFT_548127 [Trematosphaeria pertusa]KAF2253725.1 hypothetical protein BU26DRAFT_548127 [Trematosphaeria pertusa]